MDCSVKFSPKGTYQAQSRLLGDDNWVETSIHSVPTGSLEKSVRWRSSGGEGGACGLAHWLRWLDGERLLIPQTLDQGPLLVDVGKENIRIAQDIFQQPFKFAISGDDYRYLTAAAAVDRTTGAEHILLFYDTASRQEGYPPVRIYHSEDGQIETLPETGDLAFSPNGHWLVNKAFLTVRAVDLAGSSWISIQPPLPGPSQVFGNGWSPDSQKITVLSFRRVVIYRVADGNMLTNWWTGDDIQPIPVLDWSPDSRWVALTGTEQPGPDGAVSLFVGEVAKK